MMVSHALKIKTSCQVHDISMVNGAVGSHRRYRWHSRHATTRGYGTTLAVKRGLFPGCITNISDTWQLAKQHACISVYEFVIPVSLTWTMLKAHLNRVYNICFDILSPNFIIITIKHHHQAPSSNTIAKLHTLQIQIHFAPKSQWQSLSQLVLRLSTQLVLAVLF